MANSLTKDSAIYGLGTILTRAMGFLLIPLYTRFLTVSDYGVLALLNLILQVMSFVCLLGISSASMRFYYERHADAEYRQALYGNATILLTLLPPLLLAAFGFGIYLLAGRFIPSIPFTPFILIILCVAGFTPIIKLMSGLLRVQQRPVAFITFDIAFFIVQTGMIIIAIGFLGYGLKGQLYSQLIANALFWVIAFAVLYQSSTFTLSKNISVKLLAYGIPLIPFFIFIWLESAAGRFLLENYTSLELVGIFSLAAQFGGVMLLFSGALDNALMPHFFRTASNEGSSIALGRLVNKYLALFALLGLCIVVFAEPVILFVAAPEYHDAIQYVAPLTLAFWLSIATQPFTWSLSFSKKTGLLSVVRSLPVAILLLALVFFLGYMDLGIWGVIHAMILSSIFTIILGFIASQMYYRISYPLGRILTITLTMLACGIAIYSLPTDAGPGGFAIKLLILSVFILCAVKVADIGTLLQLFIPRRATGK